MSVCENSKGGRGCCVGKAFNVGNKKLYHMTMHLHSEGAGYKQGCQKVLK